jgi:RNA polymerase sigma-70 factor (ECF subfamily)
VEAVVLVPADADLDARVGRHQVIEQLGLLPPRQRQVMAWTFDGYTPAEIAEELGLSSATVRGSMRKARNTLARHVEWTDTDPR